MPFQENPKTGDCRISGTCASLTGLEKALNEEGPAEVDFAIRRILLLHGIIMTVGGIPLLYLGDEIGTLNDYAYRDDPTKARDSRWVHRPQADWKRYANRSNSKTIEGRVYQGLQQLISLRKKNPVFSGGDLEIIDTENDHVLGYTRIYKGRRAVIFVNFSEEDQLVAANVVRQLSLAGKKQLAGNPLDFKQGSLILPPLELTAWL